MTAEASPRTQSAPYLLFALLLSIYAVGALAVSTFFELPPGTKEILSYADNAVCVLFFADFLVTLIRAKNRARYLLTWGWLDLLSSIPAIDALRWGRAARVLRILRVLRGIRATKVLSELILYRRAQSAFLAALLVSLLLIVFSASAILQLENSPDANIRSPEDAVWWAVVTITTVGYGDKFPISSEGRLIAALLMTAGVGLFGTFSGFVAAWFLGSSSRQSAELETIQALESQVRELRDEEPSPLATSVQVTADQLIVELADGRTISVPIVWFPRLLKADAAARNHWEVIGEGDGIHWPDIDEDISVAGLLRGERSAESRG